MRDKSVEDNEIQDYDADFFIKDLTEIKQFEKDYFNSIIEFLKWTTTFSLAAIVWIISSFRIIGINSNVFQILSITFLSISIILSILTIYSFIFLTGSELDSRLMFNDAFAKIRIIKDNIKRYPYGKYHSFLLTKLLPRFPYQFNMMILLHLTFLLVGVIFYASSLIFI